MNDIDKILKKALSPTRYPSEELNEKIIKQGKLKESDHVYLREAFDQEGSEVMQTVTDGAYSVTYLGHVTGEYISDRTSSSWELNPDRIYVAVAIEKVDKTPMEYEDTIFVSPLIQGLTPWKYNIGTMNGGSVGKIIDGVLYRIIQCDNVEMFADKKLYLAVSDTAFFSIDAFLYNEATGEITVNEAYEGTNILFDLELDPSKADPIKAKEYLDRFEQEWNSSAENSPRSSLKNGKNGDGISEENPRVQQEVFKDEENGITIRIKDNDSQSWGAGVEYAETILSYYLEVEGDNIEALTYTLNQGEFSNKPDDTVSATEYYGKECSLTYEEQKDRNYQYAINFKGYYEDYGYDIEEVSKLGETDIDAREKIYYEVLDKAISDTKMSLEIKMKDGKTVNKTLTFKNVLNDYLSGLWITIGVE